MQWNIEFVSVGELCFCADALKVGEIQKVGYFNVFGENCSELEILSYCALIFPFKFFKLKWSVIF